MVEHNDEHNEVSYYPEIVMYLQTQIESNFLSAYGTELHVFCKFGNLKSKLREIINENHLNIESITNFANSIPPLDVDIFALITDGIHFELLILEIKKTGSLGLAHWSQLIGYCIVSGAKYGLLVNVDNGVSNRLVNLLGTDENLSSITRIKSDVQITHRLGVMQWDSLTHNMRYTRLGDIKSLPELCLKIHGAFEGNAIG